MSQALYRKYRSRGFDEVVGQQHVTNLLATAVKDGAISHAYLFTGPRGTGKTSVARILAHAINDLPYADDATHLDIIEIDAASNRRIDDIRDLREKVHIAPTSAKYKVYIIDEVHMLTTESFNALLKTIEEPPAHVVFILATTDVNKVPATIISRTQRFHFHPGSRTAIAEHLRTIAEKESIRIDKDALELIAEHSGGGFRDSVSLLDQTASLSQETISRDMVESLLGLVPARQIQEIVRHIIANDASQALTTVHILLTNGIAPPTIVGQLCRELQNHPLDQRLYELLYELIEVPKSHAPDIKLLAVIGKYSSSFSEETQSQTDSKPAARPSVASKLESTQKKTPPIPSVSVSQNDTTSDVSDVTIDDVTVDWDAVMVELKKTAPTLHSIVKNASVNKDKDGITLVFTKAFHSKKLRDDKHRQQLTAAIQAACGVCPPIIIAEGTTELNNTAKAVVELMGGGEAVVI